MSDPYASHIPVLDRHVRIGDHVVEFGCGKHSTQFFINRCADVTSIEMQDPQWLESVSDMVGAVPNWRGFLALGPWAFLTVRLQDRIDVGFVDGHSASRFGCVNYLMRLDVPVIIAHDTDRNRYHWDRIDASGYERKDYPTKPMTSVWTRVNRSRETCESCSGKGWFIFYRERQECQPCNGTGTIQ